MSKELAARKLSGALGRKVSAEDIAFVGGDLVELTDGSVYTLGPSNSAYAGDGQWFKNARPWDRDA